MAIEYKNLSDDDKNRIRGDIQGRDVDDTDYDAFLPAWEAEHFSHTVLLEKAEAEGDEEAANAAREALSTLEGAVTNVRAGKRPDGSDRPTRPTPPSPEPAPVEPTPPAPEPAPTDPDAPVQTDEPTPPAPRRAAAKKKEEE